MLNNDKCDPDHVQYHLSEVSVKHLDTNKSIKDAKKNIKRDEKNNKESKSDEKPIKYRQLEHHK